MKNNNFNIGRFKYPDSTVLMEFNDATNAIREITREELDRLKGAENNNLVTVSQYYFRDNRLYEYYILLKYIMHLEELGAKAINREYEEKRFLSKINTQNNKNWRNAFITLSNLGFINLGTNLATLAGKQMAILSYEDFVVSMYHAYLQPYSDLFVECFNENDKLNANNQSIISRIKKMYNDRDVLYVTESDGRYVSSWMNIFRDDLGMIDFKPRCSERKLVYNPSDYNDEVFAKKVHQSTIAQKYIAKYVDLLNGRI